MLCLSAIYGSRSPLLLRIRQNDTATNGREVEMIAQPKMNDAHAAELRPC